MVSLISPMGWERTAGRRPRLPEEKANAPNGDKTEQNAKDPKPAKGKGGKKKVTKDITPKCYVIAKDGVLDDARIVHESDLSSVLLEYAEENDIKPEALEVHELGKRVKVKTEVKVLPWSGP